MKKTTGWQAAGRDRFRPIIDFMKPAPDESLLEIGCGNGVFVEMIHPILDRGSITAIDRSVKMTLAARQRNASALASGRARILTASLADFQTGDAFSKILAINVNVFWMKPQRELAAARRLLAQGGTLFLFYQPPAGTDVSALKDKLRRNLEVLCFGVTREEEVHTSTILTSCTEARPF